MHCFTSSLCLQYLWGISGRFCTYTSLNSKTTFPTSEAEASNFKVDDLKAFGGIPNTIKNLWEGYDENWWVTPTTVSSSRKGIDYFELLTESTLRGPANDTEVISGGAGARGPNKVTFSVQGTFAAGGPYFSVTVKPKGVTVTTYSAEFMDMNGDRFPDLITNDKIQFTEPNGAMGSKTAGGSGVIRKSTNESLIIGGPGTAPSPLNDPFKKQTAANSNQTPSITITPSIGTSASVSTKEFMDMNGDGLPDKVETDGSGIKVYLNLGYGFDSDSIDWGNVSMNKSTGTTYPGLNLGWSDQTAWFGGGASINISDSKTNAMNMDINGDGLADYVVQSGGSIKVRLNTGTGFYHPELDLRGIKRRLAQVSLILWAVWLKYHFTFQPAQLFLSQHVGLSGMRM